MKDETASYSKIQSAARSLLARGERCSTEIVAKAAGLTMEDTPVVFRALAAKNSGFVPEWMEPGMFTVFKEAR